MRIASIKQTCGACPSQWEARTVDDRPVYIRYRYGFLSVRIGPQGADIWSAVGGTEIYGDGVGDAWDGVIELDEVCQKAGLILEEGAEA